MLVLFIMQQLWFLYGKFTDIIMSSTELFVSFLFCFVFLPVLNVIFFNVALGSLTSASLCFCVEWS